MDRVIELSGCVARSGREATILLQVSVPLRTHIHNTPTCPRRTTRSGAFLGMSTFPGPSLPAQLVTNLNPSPALEGALSLFVMTFLLMGLDRQRI